VSRQPVHLGYDFVPVPRTVQAAFREGRLSAVEADLLRYLYERADFGPLGRRAETPRLTRERIAEGIHWEGELDSLTRLLHRLRSEGWFDYRVERGRGKKGGSRVYVFQLLPDPPASGISEDGIALGEPDSSPAEPEAVRDNDPVRHKSAINGASASGISEAGIPLPETVSASAEPEPVRHNESAIGPTSSGQEADSSGITGSATPLPEPDSAPPPAEPVRPPQKDQREENPRSEEGNALGKTTTIPERVETSDDSIGSRPWEKSEERRQLIEHGRREIAERNGDGREPDEAATTERLIEKVETRQVEPRSQFQAPPPRNGKDEEQAA
jgi:hypothetical protein